MGRKTIALALGCALTCLCPCTPVAAQDEAPVVSVTPEETDELLANPGMGWQTFHCTGKQDRSLPAWLPSTVHYARWGWGEVEPKDGEINHAFLDKVLKETRESGQKLAFRVMCCSTSLGRPYHPAWLKDAGGRELRCDYEGRRGFLIPDLDHPVVLQKHLDLIKRLGERYDGHPDIDHVDLGSVGWWGEWHLSGSRTCTLPTLENRKRIVDAYLKAFRQTPLVMLIGGGECLKYAAERGTGWRADCLGDMGGFSRTWCHMRNGYPQYIREGGIRDTWKTAPVAWETCWDMRKWVNEGWSLRFIFNYALALHGSYVNNKSAPLPEGADVRPELERFLRRLGYRLVLKGLAHPAKAKAGTNVELRMQWQNVGSAPCYRPYRLAYRLSGQGGYQKVLVSKITVSGWLPGSVEVFTPEFFKAPPDLPPGPVAKVADTLSVPDDAPAGACVLSVAVVGQQAAEPVVRLGIKGRAADGWYPLSKIEVVR